MYPWVGAKCLHSSAKIGGQGISHVVAHLREGGVCLGDASFVGVIDGLLVFGGGVGFGPCCALILGRCDVAVYEGVFVELAKAGGLLFQSFVLCFVFEGAGNWVGVQWRGKSCVANGWVCCKMG